MSDRTRSSARKLAAALVTGAVAICLVLGPAPARAQNQATIAAHPLRVSISTSGTWGYVRPYADVSVSSPAYVAVFEVEPDIGAVMLWPYQRGRSERVTRHVSLELAGPRQARYREIFRDHLIDRFLLASRIRPRAYYLVIASRRPMDLSRLESGRVFPYPRRSGTAYEVARSLVDAVVGGPRSEWDYDVTSILKGRDATLGLAFAGYTPYTTGPGYYDSRACTAAIQSGYFGDFFFPAYGQYAARLVGCPPVFYRNPYGWSWFAARPPERSAPDHVAEGPPGVMNTDSVRVGNPRPVNPPRVLPDAPTAAGRDEPVKVAGLNVGAPRPGDGTRVAPEPPTGGKAGPGVLPPVEISVPSHEKKNRQKDMDPEKVRQILDRLADATRTASLDPGTVARERQEFHRAGLSNPGRVSIDMVRQRVTTSKRLFTRLRDLGVPADQARHAATASGRAPVVSRRSGGVSVVGAHHHPGGGSAASGRPHAQARTAPARARSHPRPSPPRPAHGSHGSTSHVSPPRPSHVSPPRPSHVSPPRPSHSEPARPSRPAKGGGSGHGG